ncbi:hypothetical protein AXX17_AT1G14820 [Arabidopsis thaliana]|uniref:apyrase n=1 Tax=Arabidopsis thaliana TaxID=3702 RepID=A0A178WDX1_ARATH|nr:hypothetical protein AXX17_AT1G14820 [Arabidopsis thaliana]
MDALKVQILPDNQSSPSSTHMLTKPKSKKATKSIAMLIVASLAITLGLLFVFSSNSVMFSASFLRRSSLHYSVIIDAGSSGTRIHVFGYWFESGKPVFDFGEEHYASLKLSPGLSSYADNPEGASVSVTKLVEFAKGRIPKGKLKKSDIRLMATAGMRLLDVPVQEQILDVTRRVLRSSGFKFQDEWATVISGTDEGIYAWVVGLLPITHLVRLVVTFVPSEHVPPEFSRTISYGNVSYTIYSHSFLDFGQDAAEDKLLESLQNSVADSTGDGIVEDPCTPKGYIYDTHSQKDSSGFLSEESKFKASLQVQAAGDFTKCRSATLAMLQEGKENCAYKHCSIGSTFTPNIQGSFLATENFFHTSKFFGLGEKEWLSEMILAGKRFCGEEWSKLKEKYPTTKDKYLHRYCFSSAYIISMLHDSLGVALDDERIKYASKAGKENIPLDWALGAFILNTDTPTSDYNGKSRKMIGFK